MRRIFDQTLLTTVALSAAGASTASDPIDLGEGFQFPTNEHCQFAVDVPALANLAEGETVTLKVQHAATTAASDFLDLPGASAIITGDVGGGAVASSFAFSVPPDCRRYLRLHVAVSAAGGDNTAVEATLALAF